MKKSRKRINYVGKIARVRSSFGESDLPEGLPEGSTVKIVGFNVGQFDVEHRGRQFRISMACVENLHQLWN